MNLSVALFARGYEPVWTDISGRMPSGGPRKSAGGGAVRVPLDDGPDLTSQELTPEQIFHREWQRAVFSQAAADLRELCESQRRPERFQVFAAYDLADDVRPSYEELARTHSLSVTTVTNVLSWARREMRKLLEARVGKLAGNEQERQRELRSLFLPPERRGL